MTPPQRLGRELVHLRRRGLTFRQAWPVALSSALAGLGRSDGIWWRRTFNEQRNVWALSYSRVAWPARDTTTLFSPDREQGPHNPNVLVA